MSFASGEGFIGGFQQLGGLLYSDGGAVIDPSSGTQAGQFVLRNPGTSSANLLASGAVLPDASTGNAYATYDDSGGEASFHTLESFSLSQYSPIAIVRSPVALTSPVRWGTNGLALMGFVANEFAQYNVFLIHGSFVAPAAGTITSGRARGHGAGTRTIVGSFVVKGPTH